MCFVICVVIVVFLFVVFVLVGDDVKCNYNVYIIMCVDIVDIVVNFGQFNMLVVVVQIVGFVDMLKGDGLFMVFVLFDLVFVGLLYGEVDCLFCLENCYELIDILIYYVVLGVIMVDQFFGQILVVEMVEGFIVLIDVIDGVCVGNVQVVQVDICISNGIIYVVDCVIILIVDQVELIVWV